MHWHFGPFRLDLANACLWHAEQLVILRPKTFAVLVYLVTHAGQLVTKEAFFDAIWPETAVGDGVLKTSMNELRRALGETAKAPQWIATVYRRGYRFVAPVTLMESIPRRQSAVSRRVLPAPVPAFAMPPAPVSTPTLTPRLVGREAEVATLHQWFASALQGERHLGFITGEAGIGKTTLVDTFVAQLAARDPCGSGVASALSSTVRAKRICLSWRPWGRWGAPQTAPVDSAAAPAGAELVAQLPALLSPAEYKALQRYAWAEQRGRMLRELAEALEAFTMVQPCVLVVEDLHWSDTATIEWLAYMARRRAGPAAGAGDVSSCRGDCADAPRACHGARTHGARLWGRTGPGGVVRSGGGRLSGPARRRGGGPSRTGTSADAAHRWSSAVCRGARG